MIQQYHKYIIRNCIFSRFPRTRDFFFVTPYSVPGIDYYYDDVSYEYRTPSFRLMPDTQKKMPTKTNNSPVSPIILTTHPTLSCFTLAGINDINEWHQ